MGYYIFRNLSVDIRIMIPTVDPINFASKFYVRGRRLNFTRNVHCDFFFKLKCCFFIKRVLGNKRCFVLLTDSSISAEKSILYQLLFNLQS